MSRHDSTRGLYRMLKYNNRFSFENIIKAKWIFESPRGTAFKLSHSIQSLWELFEPYELTFNHRQGEDKEYGNLLNRLRWLPPFTKEEKKQTPPNITSRDRYSSIFYRHCNT